MTAPDPPKTAPDRCALIVIEDDGALRMALHALFEREAWVADVTSAATGSEGLRTLEERGADVLLTDARLPDIALDELLERAARVSPDTRLVVHTGLDEVDTIVRSGARYAAYVQKGRDPALLMESLRAICRVED